MTAELTNGAVLPSSGGDTSGAALVEQPASTSRLQKGFSPQSAPVAADYECSICSDLLLDPVTNACGHDFCRGCLEQWRKVSEQQQQQQYGAMATGPCKVLCPICRADLSQGLGVCQRLKNLVESYFPEQIAKRRADYQATASEVEKRSRKLLDLQACFAGPRFLDASPQRTPVRPGQHTPDRVSLPAPAMVPFFGSQASTHDASLLSTWDQDQPPLLVADLAASPCLSSRSSQTLPASNASLPSTAATWLAPINHLTAMSDSHTHHHYHHYHLHPLPCAAQQQQRAVGEPGPLASPDRSQQRGGHGGPAVTPLRFMCSGALPQTPSGHRMSASGTSLPPLPPRRQAFTPNRLLSGAVGEPVTPREPPPPETQFFAPAVRTSSQGPSQDWGLAGSMDCFMDSDTVGPLFNGMGRSTMGAASASLNSVQDTEQDEDAGLGVEHSELTFGALAGPDMQAQLLQMGQLLRRRDSGSETSGDSDSPPRLCHTGTALMGAQGNEEHEGQNSTIAPLPSDVPDTPRATNGPVDASFEFFAQAHAGRSTRAGFPNERPVRQAAARVSYDGSTSTGFDGFLADRQQQPQLMLQSRRQPQRRPSEPGCGSRAAPTRAASVNVLLGGSETKFTAALKRMREEDDAAQAAGRPRTSAMRQLFVSEGGAAARGARLPPPPSRPVAPIVPAWPPTRVRRSESTLVSTPDHAGNRLPACNSISAPVSVSALSTMQRAAHVLTFVPERAQLPPSIGGSPRPESWMPPPSMRLQPASGWRRATHDGSVCASANDYKNTLSPTGLNSAFFDSFASSPSTHQVPGTDAYAALPHATRVHRPSDGTDFDITQRYANSTPSLAASEAPGSLTSTPPRNSHHATPTDEAAMPMDGVVDCHTPVAEYRSPNSRTSRCASPCPPLPSLVRSQSAITSTMPSILQLASPLRIARRNTTIDTSSRTCPNTPRARHVEPASPFNHHKNSSALIAALMLPPPPPADAVVRAQRAAATTALELAGGGPMPAMTVPTAPFPLLIRSLEELIARPSAQPRRPQPWHSYEKDKPVRSACSCALAAAFTEWASGTTVPHGNVFIYVKGIEEHLYFTATSLQQYADLSTLHDRMVQAVDELICMSRNPPTQP